jgi:diguanylate cyclase (GGDEF)-like protein
MPGQQETPPVSGPLPFASPPGARLSGRFPGAEEAAYHEKKFEELRRFSQRTFLSLPLLIIGLWIWDWAIDPSAAPRTLTLRLGMAACLLPCILALRTTQVNLKAFTVLLYASVLATEVFWLAILRRLDGGLVYGIGGYMYYVLGMLLVGLPLRFWDNVMGLSLALMVPNAAAAAGWLPGFSYTKYNALIIPAGALSLFTFWAFDRLYRRTFSYQRTMEQLVGEDALTGLANRRQFMLAGAQLLERVHRYGRPGSLLVIDLDHFKAINDRYGHAAGDVALQATARLLREHQRGADLAVRLGGEEFAMLLPETDLEGAATLAERLRAACDALRLEVPGGALTGMQVTMSIGATGCGAEDRSMDDVLRRADAALYRAKHGGRNRVELA